MNDRLFGKITKILFDVTIYKMICVCAFMLIPSALLFYIPKYISAALLLWGAIILIKDLVTQKKCLGENGTIFLLIFVVSYVITLIFFAKNDLISTLNVYFWTIIEFFILFAMQDNVIEIDEINRNLRRINFGVSLVAFVTGLLSIVIFIMKISIVMPDPEGINQYWSIGIANGRNSGIFNNPIPYASAMMIGFVASLSNMLSTTKSLRPRIFYSLTIIICIVGISTSLTRTFMYSLYIFSFLTGIVISFSLFRNKPILIIKAAVSSLFIGLVIVGALFVTNQATQNALVSILASKKSDIILIDKDVVSESIIANDSRNNIAALNSSVANEKATIDAITENTTANDSGSSTSALSNHVANEQATNEIEDAIIYKLGLSQKVNLQRTEISRLPNFLYPRDELWRIALQVIPHSPIFGFTSGNRMSSSKEYGSTKYLSNLAEGVITYHNAYFDIAVSAGLLGLIVLLVFLVYQVVRILKAIRSDLKNFGKSRMIWWYTISFVYIFIHIAVTSNLFGVIALNNISTCIYFWILLGIISNTNGFILKDSSKLSVSRIKKQLV